MHAHHTRAGRTGFPLVDAGMRQLWATGWMQQSVRMVAAAFLTEYLNLNWLHGARCACSLKLAPKGSLTLKLTPKPPHPRPLCGCIAGTPPASPHARAHRVGSHYALVSAA